MALESLPSRWHSQSLLSSRPFRPFCPSDGCVDSSRTLVNRRNSESSGRPRSLTRQRSVRACVDGGVPPGSGVRSDRALKILASSPSFGPRRSSGSGFNEEGRPRVLQRWKSDGAMVLRRAIRFEEFGGEESWRKPTAESSLPDVTHEGFQRFDCDLVSSSRDNGGFAKNETGMRFDTHFGSGDVDYDRTMSNVEASAVDVTAPSFVRDRSFGESSYLPPRFVKATSESNTGEAASSCRTRPATLKRRVTKNMSLDKAQGKGGLDRPETAVPAVAGPAPIPQVPQGLGISSGYVAIPDSLRKLKKRNKNVLATAGETACCSIKKAFDSMVFMIRALQNCAFEMRQVFVSTNDLQNVLAMVQREMQLSFVWLFQQVFSCTPTLMVSVMILLANFTVFSLGNNVAIGAVMDPPTPLVSILQRRVDSEGPVRGVDWKPMFSFIRVDPAKGSSDSHASSAPTISPVGESTSSSGSSGSGGSRGRSVVVAGGADGDHFSRFYFQRNAMFSERVSDTKAVEKTPGQRPVLRPGSGNTVFLPTFEEISGGSSSASRRGGIEDGLKVEELGTSEEMTYRNLLDQTARELQLKAGEPHQHVVLDQETVRRLVAPVTARMESDNYICFDRTDLEYQHAIRDEPTNTMLLVNYAQFLFAVRRDNRGAEHYFSKALKLDREDGDIWARWGVFLWLGRDNKPAADEAYLTALALDPCNPYHAGSYAHFLWHSDDTESNACLLGQS